MKKKTEESNHEENGSECGFLDYFSVTLFTSFA